MNRSSPSPFAGYPGAGEPLLQSDLRGVHGGPGQQPRLVARQVVGHWLTWKGCMVVSKKADGDVKKRLHEESVTVHPFPPPLKRGAYGVFPLPSSRGAPWGRVLWEPQKKHFRKRGGIGHPPPPSRLKIRSMGFHPFALFPNSGEPDCGPNFLFGVWSWQ